MFLLLFINAVTVFSSLAAEQLLGRIEEKDLDDPVILNALDFAMNEFNAMQNNMYRLMATKVEDATLQVRKTFLFVILRISFILRNKTDRPISLVI